MALTVNEIIKQVAILCGLEEPTGTLYSSSDKDLKLIHLCLIETGRELRDYLFPQLKKTAILPLSSGDIQQNFPPDFYRMLSGTGWDRSNHWKVSGPLTDPEMNAFLYGVVTSSAQKRYRIFGANLEGGQFFLDPAPTLSTSSNSITDPDAFSASSWTKTRSNTTANAVANPLDSAVTADLLYDDATASNTHEVSATAISVTAKTFYSFSVYAKRVSRHISMRFEPSGTTSSFATSSAFHFDLTNGIAYYNPNVPPPNFFGSIESIGSDWYKCTIIGQCINSGTIQPTILLASSVGTTSYNGDGSSGAYLFRAMFNEAEVISFDYIRSQWFVPKSWTASEAGIVSGSTYRYSNGNIYIAASTATAGTLAPEHISGNRSDGSVDWTFYQNQTYGTNDRFQADTDFPLIDEDLLVKGGVWRFKMYRGFVYEAMQFQYLEALRQRLIRLNGAPIISMASTGLDQFLSYDNIPEGSYG